MPVIDNRLIDADTDMDITENFNRILATYDTLAEVVADLDESQLFRVTFDSDGGSSVANQYVVYEEKAVEPADPTKTGYTFGDWYKGTNVYNFDTKVTSHTNLKASWVPVEYSITYDLDGGALEEGVTNPSVYTIESEAITLNNPSKEGYTFAGWTGSNGDTAQTEVTIAKGSTGNKSYTANWTAVTPQE